MHYLKKEKIESFMETLFPPEISCGSKVSIEYSTNIVCSGSGIEKRNTRWTQARRRFNVLHSVKGIKHFDAIVAFFHNCLGKAVGFRFKDWSDYKAFDQLVGYGDGENKGFQIYKTYHTQLLDGTIVGNYRKIEKLVKGSVVVYVSSKVQEKLSNLVGEYRLHKTKLRVSYEAEGEGDVYVNCANGMLIFKKPPPANADILVNFEFDVPVRFDTDHLQVIMEGRGINAVDNLQIVEIVL